MTIALFTVIYVGTKRLINEGRGPPGFIKQIITATIGSCQNNIN